MPWDLQRLSVEEFDDACDYIDQRKTDGGV